MYRFQAKSPKIYVVSEVVTSQTYSSHIHKQKKIDPKLRKNDQEGEIRQIPRPLTLCDTTWRIHDSRNPREKIEIPKEDHIIFPSVRNKMLLDRLVVRDFPNLRVKHHRGGQTC